MNKPKQLILIGGGYSIREGILQNLWSKIDNKFTLGINYCFYYYLPTVNICVDQIFYTQGDRKWSKEQTQKYLIKLQNLPLIISKKHSKISYYHNTIPIQTNDNKYYRDIKLGCYRSNLCGLFALSIAIYLLDIGEIFLLGFDYKDTIINKKSFTHFYQGQIQHRGIKKTNYYRGILDGQNRSFTDFKPFIKETKCKIYNVCPDSKIEYFPKIDYPTFFKMLDKNTYNQATLRNWIKTLLLPSI